MAPRRDRDTLVESVTRTMLDTARTGVLISGEAGVGKSFAAVQVLDRLGTAGHATRRMVGAGSDDIPLGALARTFSHEEAYSGVTPLVSLKRFLDGRDEPMTVLIDDVDLLDTPSLATIDEVASSGFVRLLLTLRSGSRVPAIVERGLTNGAIERVECPPFDRRTTAALADQFAECTLTAQTHHRIFELAQGNPLFVRELIEAAREEGSIERGQSGGSIDNLPMSTGRLVDLLEQRLRTLGAEERDALRRIALVDGVGPGEIAGFVSDDVLVRLEQRKLIASVLEGRRMLIRTAHPLHAEIIRSMESPLQVRRIRTEHAVRIQELGTRRSSDLLRLATWSLDGICTVDPSVMVQASSLAAAAGDADLGRRCAEAAFEQLPNAATAHLLAVALTAIGDMDAVRGHLPRWDRLAVTAPERARYEMLSADTRYWRWGDHDAIGEFAALADGWPEPVSRADLQASAASMLVTTGRIDDAIDLASQLGEVPPGFAAVRVALALGHGWRARGKPIIAETLVAESLGLFRSISEDAYILSDVAMAGLLIQTLAEAGRFAEIDRLVAERSASWRDLAQSPTAPLVLLAQAAAWFVRGDHSQAVRLATDGAERFDEIRQVGMARWCRIMIALAHAEPGHTEMAERVLRAIDAQGPHPAQIFESSLARARAWIAYHQGNVAESHNLLVAAADTSSALGNVAGAMECLHDLARQRNATAAARRLDDIATEELEGDLYELRCAHITALAANDAARLGGCMAGFDQLGLRHLAAESAMAAAASPATTPAEAKTWLRRAAERSGAQEIDFSRFRALESLTSREREVATLAARGLTSRQIAGQLGNSRRTVESHLGSVYSKLNVDGRAGLVERLK